MKKLICIILVFTTWMPYDYAYPPPPIDNMIWMYKQTPSGMTPRDCLIMKNSEKTFDLYTYGGGSYFGDFTKSSDTLRLYRKYYYYRQDVFKEIDSTFQIQNRIPLVFLIKDRYLEEITDYMSYPELVPAFEGGYLFHYGNTFRQLEIVEPEY